MTGIAQPDDLSIRCSKAVTSEYPRLALCRDVHNGPLEPVASVVQFAIITRDASK